MSNNGASLFLALELDGADESPALLRKRVTAAEQAGFTIVTFADAVVPEDGITERLDAGTRAAFVSSATSTVGLAPTVHTLTTEPFFLATQLASLDHASHGRAAWVVGADNSAAAHAAVGSQVRHGDAVVREIRDVIGVSRQLWDSWESDAVIRDVASGRYLDPDKVHHVRFSGEFFDVVGPLITPRSPQGQIVIIADAALGVTDLVDIALVTAKTVEAITAAAAAARDAGASLVFVDLVFADTESVDLISGDLASVVDGVRLRVSSADLDHVVEEVVPGLVDAGLVRRPTEGRTLRENLGLGISHNRYAASTQN